MKGSPLPGRTYNHIAFKIPGSEFDGYRQRLEKSDVDFREGRPRVPGEGLSLYFYDYDNHLFELHTGTLAERLQAYEDYGPGTRAADRKGRAGRFGYDGVKQEDGLEIDMHKPDDQVKIREMTIRNRLVLPPLTTNYGSENGCVTPDILRFYKARSGKMGLVIVEAAAVSPEGRIIPGGIGLWEDSHIPGLAELARTIKDEGAGAVIQINHAGAKAWPFETIDSWVAPSNIACRPGITAKPASLDEIERIIRGFADGALRAKKAGFDGVEIHGAHFYLLSQFLSPLTNSRTDQYGGGTEGRAAMALEVTTAVREVVGPDYPIFFRLNILENLEGGMTPDEAIVIGKLLAKAGVDVLDLSLAVQGAWKEEDGKRILITSSAYAKDETPGEVVDLAARFRSECGLPVIAVGRLGSASGIRQAIEAGADLAAIGRQMICDPGTAGKILAGKDDLILECQACQACFACLGKGIPIRCSQNKNLPD